jgi:phage gp46-like protein
MPDIIDIALEQPEGSKIFDIDFAIDGDFETVSGFETSLTLSIYTDQRAAANEVSIPERRRGWFGDELFEDFRHGSKLWLLDQARITFNTRNLAVTYTDNCLQWLIDDGYLKSVSTVGTITSTNITLNITGTFQLDNRNTWSYTLWTNTEGLT